MSKFFKKEKISASFWSEKSSQQLTVTVEWGLLNVLAALRTAPAAWETVSPAVYNVSSILDLQLHTNNLPPQTNLINILF